MTAAFESVGDALRQHDESLHASDREDRERQERILAAMDEHARRYRANAEALHDSSSASFHALQDGLAAQGASLSLFAGEADARWSEASTTWTELRSTLTDVGQGLVRLEEDRGRDSAASAGRDAETLGVLGVIAQQADQARRDAAGWSETTRAAIAFAHGDLARRMAEHEARVAAREEEARGAHALELDGVREALLGRIDGVGSHLDLTRDLLAQRIVETSASSSHRLDGHFAVLDRRHVEMRDNFTSLGGALEAQDRNAEARALRGEAAVHATSSQLAERFDAFSREWREGEAKREAAHADREARARLKTLAFGDSLVAGQNEFHSAVTEALDALAKRLDARPASASPGAAASTVDVSGIAASVEARFLEVVSREGSTASRTLVEALAPRLARIEERLLAQATPDDAWAARLASFEEKVLDEVRAVARPPPDALPAQAPASPQVDHAMDALRATLTPVAHFRGVDDRVEERVSEIEESLEALSRSLATGIPVAGDASVGELFRATRERGERALQLLEEIRRESAWLAKRLSVADEGVRTALAACDTLERAVSP